MLETNQNKPERILRLLMALVLLPAPFLAGLSPYTIVAGTFGAVMLFNALSGACLTYRMFGVNTCKLPEQTPQ